MNILDSILNINVLIKRCEKEIEVSKRMSSLTRERYWEGKRNAYRHIKDKLELE